MTQEQREQLDRIIVKMHKGEKLSADEKKFALNCLLALQDLTYRLRGEWDKVK